MKKLNIWLTTIAIMVTVCTITYNADAQTTNKNVEASIQVDGSKKFQQMDGFGVNINTSWWLDGKYENTDAIKPAIDMLQNELGATIFRAVIEETDWEEVNDNSDPNTFNWNYYDSIFTTPRFNGVWNTLHYLNQKGITDNLIISLMGSPPASKPLVNANPKSSWMGDTTYNVSADKEDEFVETIAALLYYARNKAKIQFTLVSPMNETDVIATSKNVEGPNINNEVQFTRILKKLAKKLDEIEMSDIRFVAPDAGADGLFSKCLNEMVKDNYLMSKLVCWGVHDYGNDANNYQKIVSRSSNLNKSYWVTETAGIANMFGQLNDNPTAIIFWDGFDCVYHHARRNGYGNVLPNDWVFWIGELGKPLIAYNTTLRTWKPRKQFYEYAQLFKYIKPNATRISATSANDSLTVYSFVNPDKQLVIVGLNNSINPVTVKCSLENIPKVKSFEMVVTDKQNDLSEQKDVANADGLFSTVVPPKSVFTLIGNKKNK